MRTRLYSPALLTGGLCLSVAAADISPLDQKDRQQRVRAEVEQTARRVTTTLRILSYQKLDPTTEQKVLDEVAGGLRQLSREHIREVLEHLEYAIGAADEASAADGQREAYQKHRQVVATLRDMLTRLDVLKSIDAAALRLDKLAKGQFELRQRGLATEQLASARRGRRMVDERDEFADNQTDLRIELASVVAQLAELRPSLPPDQQERLERANVEDRGGNLIAEMTGTVSALQSGNFRVAADRQLQHAQECQAIAVALRAPRDRVSELRELREQVERIREAEEALGRETSTTPEMPRPQQRVRGDRNRPDPAMVRAAELAGKQEELEFGTRQARQIAGGAAEEVTGLLSEVEAQMRHAAGQLRENLTEAAVPAQQSAVEHLRQARDVLDDLLTAAERERSDPLAATKKAADEIAKLIRDQEATKELTRNQASQPDRLKPASDSQREVVRNTEEVRRLPMPDNSAVKEALAKALAAAREAAAELAKRDAPAALPKQDDTLQALHEAKRALEEQAAAIEKRREEIAKLDDAARKLDDLTKAEREIATGAKAAASNEPSAPKPSELAQRQDDLTSPTRELGQGLRDLVPQLSDKLSEAADVQGLARDALARNEPSAGAGQANDAARKLQEARDELAKKRDELTAREIADETALQPNKVDPAAAAQQLAKAIEQANRAAEQAEAAAQRLTRQQEQDPTAGATGRDAPRAESPDPARLQQEIAERAEQLRQRDAAQAAADAAESLRRGDLPAALERQQEALDQLRQAEASRPNEQLGQLADAQRELQEATRARAESERANAAAQAALGQAQAQAPKAVQPRLGEAGQQLREAGQQLGEGQPADAARSNAEASRQLSQALSTLNEAAQAMGQPTAQPGQNQQASADRPGQQPGQQPGQGQSPGNRPGQQPGQRGDSQERNEGVSEGDRTGPGPMRNAAARTVDLQGDGSFIHLQKRERDKVQQNAEAAFPAEFREQIKQYNLNVKKDPPITPAAR